MKISPIATLLLHSVGIVAASNQSISGLLDIVSRAGTQSGRECDYTDGYYVDWSDCGNAAAQWCHTHAGQVVNLGQSITGGDIGGYKSGKWNVQLTVKYQNDHFDYGWEIDEDACNWYINYIAQGCTPGGNKPTDSTKHFSDGGTYYEPLLGSVDMKWKYAK